MKDSGYTREKIISATEQIIAERKDINVTVRMITQRANVNLSLVNYHFKSKEILINEVFKGIEDRLVIILKDNIEKSNRSYINNDKTKIINIFESVISTTRCSEFEKDLIYLFYKNCLSINNRYKAFDINKIGNIKCPVLNLLYKYFRESLQLLPNDVIISRFQMFLGVVEMAVYDSCLNSKDDSAVKVINSRTELMINEFANILTSSL